MLACLCRQQGWQREYTAGWPRQGRVLPGGSPGRPWRAVDGGSGDAACCGRSVLTSFRTGRATRPALFARPPKAVPPRRQRPGRGRRSARAARFRRAGATAACRLSTLGAGGPPPRARRLPRCCWLGRRRWWRRRARTGRRWPTARAPPALAWGMLARTRACPLHPRAMHRTPPRVGCLHTQRMSRARRPRASQIAPLGPQSAAQPSPRPHAPQLPGRRAAASTPYTRGHVRPGPTHTR